MQTPPRETTQIEIETEATPALVRWMRSHKGDFAGGFASAALAVGGNVAVGIIAFAPLSENYVSLGVLAGMLSSVVGGLLATLLGSAPGMITGPKATTAMVFAGLLISLRQILPDAADDLLLSLAFGAVLISGSVQLLLGAVGFGELGKFIPYPVVAGIRTATAVLLIYSQFWSFIGVDRQPFSDFLADPGQLQWATLLVAVATALVTWNSGRLIPKAKALVPLGALIFGTLLHHALRGLGVGPLGPQLKTLSLDLSLPDYTAWWSQLTDPTSLGLVAAIVSGALAMALLDSMALISLVSFQDIARRRFDGDSQLIGQGVGTVASALVGGLSTSCILPRAMMNHGAGGRTRVSGVFHAVVVLVLAVGVASLLGLVPKAATAGVIIVMAFKLFDPWTGTQLRELRRTLAHERRDNRNNLLQMLFVVAVGILTNLVWRGYGLVLAVGAGVVVSVFAFAVGMARDPFRGEPRTGHRARSWRERYERFEKILEKDGAGIALIQLKGAIFFGTCDKIVAKVDEVIGRLPHDGRRVFVVLDLDRVPSVDATGLKLLGQTHSRLKSLETEVELVFSFITPGGRRKEVAEELVAVGIPEESMFYTTDDALEQFEEEVIKENDPYEPREPGWTVADFGNTWGLSPEESSVLAEHTTRRAFERAESLFEEGETDRSMFLLSTGTVDVFLGIPDDRRRHRVATFSPGTLVGEMGLLDGQPRSATVTARTRAEAFELTLEAFERLRSDRAEIVAKIEAGVGRVARVRLRYANRIIKELGS